MAADPYVPFCLAAVELAAEKLVVMGQVVPGVTVDDLTVGDEVELVIDTLYSEDGPTTWCGSGARSELTPPLTPQPGRPAGRPEHARAPRPDDKKVAVLGAGMHEWGKWGRPFVEYGLAAARDAMADAGLGWRDMQFVSGADTIRNGYPGFVSGATFAQALGWTGRPGLAASTPPVRPERWPSPTPARKSWPGCATWPSSSAPTPRPKGFFAPVGGGDRKNDPDWLRFHLMGATNPTYFGLYARRRMDRFGATEEDFAQVKVKNARHGLANPYARYRKEVTVDEVLASPMVADPLRLLEICATSDGGAALVLTSMDFARRHAGGAEPLVTIDAVSTVTPTFPNTVIEMPNFSTDSAAARGPTGAEAAAGFRPSIATAAYAEAGIGPEDVEPGRGLRPLVRPRARLVRGHRPVRRGGGREAAARRGDHPGRPGAGEPLGRSLLLRGGHPGPGHRPGLRVRLAAPGHRHRAPGRGGPGGRHGQPGPVRARFLGPAEPLKPW